jgi:quinol-cytochrome oxidoreductase complex cytochrome b subunit
LQETAQSAALNPNLKSSIEEVSMVHPHNHSSSTPWWKSSSKIALYVFLGIIAFFLITEHLAHLIPLLPWAFLLLCPLMHLFMHGGHGGHGGGDDPSGGGHAGHDRSTLRH